MADERRTDEKRQVPPMPARDREKARRGGETDGRNRWRFHSAVDAARRLHAQK